jgi:hypothetical protein
MRALRLARSPLVLEQLVLRLPGTLDLGVEDLLELLGEPRSHPLALGRPKVVIAAPVTLGLGGREVELVVAVRVDVIHSAERAPPGGRPSSATSAHATGRRSAK